MSPSSISLLENFASYCELKNKILAQNIANSETQGYQRQDVVFKDVLGENMGALLKTTNSRQIGSTNSGELPSFKIVTDHSNDNGSGVNNVDIDKEMSELAVNNLNYQFAAKKIGDYFSEIQMIIKGAVG